MKFPKHVFNVIVFFFTISCVAYNFDFEPNTSAQLLSIFEITKRAHTVVLDVENETSFILKNNLIKNLHRDQSVLVVGGKKMPELITEKRLMEMLIRNANIMFNMKYLNSSILDSPILRTMLQSQKSVLLITVSTEDSLYKCENGKLNDEAHTRIENFLNELWHKYRTLIVMLSLPYVCPNEYVVFGDLKASNGYLYNRTIKLVNTTRQLSKRMTRKARRMLTRKYPLRGNIFNRFPTAMENCSGTDMYMKTKDILGETFCGMDALVMADVVRHFKFNLSMPPLGPGHDKFGYQQDDGVVTGSLGYIVRGDLDVSFNSRFMVKYVEGIRPYQILFPIAQDSLCALLKHPDEEPLWRYPYKAYSLVQWLSIYTSLISVGLFMWVCAKIKKRFYHSKASSLFSYVRNSVNAGLFGFFLVRRNDLLILRGVCLYASIMLLATYQSYINYAFTTRWYKPMNKLSDLVKAGTVITTTSSTNTLLEIPSNDVQATLQTRTIVLEDVNFFDYVLNHRNTAALERYSDAILLTLMAYMGDDGRPQLYVANECFRVFYLSYITNRSFPFKEQLQVFMMRLVESGLPGMYYTWTSRSLGLEVTLPSMTSEPRQANKITMSSQIIPFSILLIGYFLSTVVLVVEIWKVKRTKLFPYLP